MKAVCTITLIILLLSSTSRFGISLTPQPNAGVALLTQPKGAVKISRGHHTETLADDALLNVGDVVTIAADGGAVIYQAYAPVKRLVANENLTVKTLSPPPQGSALTLEEFGSFKRNYLIAHQNRHNLSPITQGGSEDANLTLLEPRNSFILDGKPTFVWTRAANATKYVVNIYDGNEKVVCSQSTTDLKLLYPSACNPLEPGAYKWDVTAQIGDKVSDDPALYDATSFARPDLTQTGDIVSAVQHAQTISESDIAARSVYAATLLEHHLYPQAEVELLRSLRDDPADQALWALLIETYFQMKRWPAREKARKISVADHLTPQMVWTLNKR